MLPTASVRLGSSRGADGAFYGTTGGTTTSYGTVFKVTAEGVFTTLYDFTGGTDGSYLQAAPVQGSDGNFYGTSRKTVLYPSSLLVVRRGNRRKTTPR